jgi:hypothetical protein
MYDTSLSPEANLARSGLSKNGFPLNVPKDTDTTTYSLDYFTDAARQSTLSPDDEAHQSADAIEAGIDHAQLAQRDAARAANLRTAGQHERADEAMRHAEHFTNLDKLTRQNFTRQTLRVRHLASNPWFVKAVRSYDFETANGIMIDTLRDKEAPCAQRIACIGAMIQIAPYVGTDDGSDFNDKWLSRQTGMARSCCKELFDMWRVLGTDIAEVLIGTEYGEKRGDVRAFIKANEKRLREAAEQLSAYHTFALIEHAGACEEVAREHKISRRDLRVLQKAGINNEAGWEQLVKMPLKRKESWLVAMEKQTEEWATRTGGIVATAKSAVEPEKSKLVKPPTEYTFTGRLLTQRQLRADNVYEL